jgi:hypothetical protein
LRLVFPARVGARFERVLRLGFGRQVKEFRGQVESLVDPLLRDAVVDELKEPDGGRGLPERVGNLVKAVEIVAHVDLRDFPFDLHSDPADAGFLVELGEPILLLCGHVLSSVAQWARWPGCRVTGAMTHAAVRR